MIFCLSMKIGLNKCKLLSKTWLKLILLPEILTITISTMGSRMMAVTRSHFQIIYTTKVIGDMVIKVVITRANIKILISNLMVLSNVKFLTGLAIQQLIVTITLIMLTRKIQRIKWQHC